MKRSGLLAASIATLVLFSLRQDVGAASSNSSETYKQLNLFGEVFERVRAEYVDDVSDDSLVESAINGMLTSLDPHSNYLNTKNFNDMKVQTRGEFGGLGIEVSMENGLVKVVSPIDDTPAARAGLKPGDLITHLDGDPVQGMTLPEAVEKMRGPVSSEIKLTIRREGKEPFDVKLTRATIKIQSVRSHLEGDNIAYIRITTFNEQTDVGLNNAMKNLKQQAGGKLLGVVLDLRNDPGGLLDQAVAVADAFLEKGEIVSTRGRRSEDAQRYNARPGDIAAGLPIAVLINGGSASASEIVAGALQDHHRAILLGTRSFGKGSVQTIIPLPGHGAMRLTTARYYTPSGRSIQAKGIDPDIFVEAAKIEKTPEKSEAKVATASDLKRDDSGDGGAEQSSVDPSIMGTPADYQLTRAVDMLRGIALFNGRVVN
ncbi:MAG: S41 family peptidase [Alphaproteobacteria bacterium]|nr:S41 family peptidase [Alphaproteobacteria bacterium]